MSSLGRQTDRKQRESYLSSSLQVAEVNVRDEEDRLDIQVGHGLEVGGV